MVKALMGAAWKEAVREDPKRHYYRAVLDLGVLGSLALRIVANPKRAKEKSPHWLIFHKSAAGTDDVRVGALWNYRHPETSVEHVIGRIRTSTFGLVELRGGAKVDLRLAGDEIHVRLSEVSERRGEHGPTHQLWRMRPFSRSKPAEAGSSGHSDQEAVEEVEGGPEELDMAADELIKEETEN